MDNSEYALLQRMRHDNRMSGRPFTPSDSIWKACCNVMSDALRANGLAQVETQTYQNHFSARPPGHKSYDEYAADMEFKIQLGAKVFSKTLPSQHDVNYERACKLLYSYVKAHDDADVLKRSQCTNANLVQVDGRVVSWDYLMSAYTANVVARHVPGLTSGPKTVVDLGAGWGRIGHVLKQVNPQLTYLILDLPESLIVSRHRIKELFPETVLDYDFFQSQSMITRESLIAKPAVGFAGPQHLQKFESKSIDLLINVNSIQEMDAGDAEMYFDLFDSRVNFLYVFAHENDLIRGAIKGRKFTDYKWLRHWDSVYYEPVGSNFFWKDFFEVIFKL